MSSWAWEENRVTSKTLSAEAAWSGTFGSMPHGAVLIGGQGKEMHGSKRAGGMCPAATSLSRCRDTRLSLYAMSLHLHLSSCSETRLAPTGNTRLHLWCIHRVSPAVCSPFPFLWKTGREQPPGSWCSSWGPPDTWRTLPRHRGSSMPPSALELHTWGVKGGSGSHWSAASWQRVSWGGAHVSWEVSQLMEKPLLYVMAGHEIVLSYSSFWV